MYIILFFVGLWKAVINLSSPAVERMKRWWNSRAAANVHNARLGLMYWLQGEGYPVTWDDVKNLSVYEANEVMKKVQKNNSWP